MLQTLFFACLRASELCNIDPTDVDFKNLSIRINSDKGGKDGICFITNECASTLRRYLEAKPKARNRRQRAFVFYRLQPKMAKDGNTSPIHSL